MATSREARMQQRMRGAQRHQVQDAEFDLFIALPEATGGGVESTAMAETLEVEKTTETAEVIETTEISTVKTTETAETATAQTTETTETIETTNTTTETTEKLDKARRTSPRLSAGQATDVLTVSGRATPNTSAKRRRLDDGGRAQGSPPQAGHLSQSTPNSSASLIARNSGQSLEEEVGESPVDAPGSGRRQSVVSSMAAASRTGVLLQKVVSGSQSPQGSDGAPFDMRPTKKTRSAVRNRPDRQIPPSSPPLPVLPQQQRAISARSLSSTMSPPDAGNDTDATPQRMQPSPDLTAQLDLVDLNNSALETTGAVVPDERSAKDSKAGGSGIFANLANTKRKARALAAASMLDDAVDELSSPSAGDTLDAVDNALPGSVPSSSPLGRKPTAGTRTARTVRVSRRGAPSAVGSRNMRTVQVSDNATTPATAAGKAFDPTVEDELSPDQPVTTAPQQRRGPAAAVRGPFGAQRPSEIPSSSPATTAVKSKPVDMVPPSSSPQPPTVGPRRGRSVAKVMTVNAEEAEEVEEEDDQPAEEIDAAEAAQTILKKRPRRSATHEPSPELGAGPAVTITTAEEPAADSVGTEARKRGRRKRQPGLHEQSASTQNQPRPAKKPARRKRKRGAGAGDGDDEDDAEAAADDSQEEMEGVGKAARHGRDGAPPVPITVQRFSRIAKSPSSRAKRRRSRGDGDGTGDDNGDDGDDDDELARADQLVFAGRSGVNAVDVLAQICEDIVEQRLLQLQDKYQEARRNAQPDDVDPVDHAAAAALRKDILVARRAIESFQQELRTRLLEQAVAVDTFHTMRKRVRVAHRQKLALREEILRLRAERDQVGLRMDALRAQHQARVQAAMKTARLSATMHEIDLAVEQGRAAPELIAAERKTADMANLELVVHRVTEQVAAGRGASTLQQIMDFNAFLERTAAVLEGRPVPIQKTAV